MSAVAKGFLCFVVLAVSASATAIVFEQLDFSTPAQEQRYRELVNELRCLVCQNQNLAESEAELAGDLRAQVFTMLQEGAGNEEIIDYMVARYGDFVLYRPPVKTTTIALWVGPFVLVAIALGILFIQITKNRARASPEDLSNSERERLTKILAASADEENGA